MSDKIREAFNRVHAKIIDGNIASAFSIFKEGYEAGAALAGQPAAEVPEDLRARCAEILAWQKTGVLKGDVLRGYAKAQWYADEHNSLQMAEADTARQAYVLLVASSVAVPEGYALVPVEPTIDMEDAGRKSASGFMSLGEAGRVYRAMLASAPAVRATRPAAEKLDTVKVPQELWPDEIHQMAFEEGQPAENGDGYLFTAEEFDLFVERLLTRSAETAAQEPAAWLVHGGRTWADRVYLSHPQAAQAVETRRDGSQLTALYAAPPAAEQPKCITSDCYRADLYDQVLSQARLIGFGNVTEALAELQRMKLAEQPDTVKVPRESVRRAVAALESRMCTECRDEACCMPDVRNSARELRALLGKEGA